MGTWRWIFLLALATTPLACRLQAECFGANECDPGLVCYRGECTEPFAIGDAGVDAGPRRYTWNDDVQPIVMRRCISCHTMPPANGAPFPLLGYADTQGAAPAGGLIYERMAARVVAMTMPPGGGMTPAEIAVVRDWAALGAPEGGMDVDGGARDLGPRPDAGFPDTGPRNPIPQGAIPLFLAGNQVVTESPVWRPGTNDLLFVDIPGNAIRRLRLPNVITDLIAPSNDAAAIRVLANGDILATQFATRRIARFPNGGAEVSIVDNYRGLAFNSPNDLDVRADGTIYFSDSAYGLDGRPREIQFNGLFRVTTTSSVVAEWEGPLTSGPNGVELSEDEQLLYLSDTEDDLVRVFDVAADGSLSNVRVLATGIDGADGMSHDDEGNIYVASTRGIVVLAPDGTSWGTISTAQAVTNTGFGGTDRRTLFITAGTAVYALQMMIAGPP